MTTTELFDAINYITRDAAIRATDWLVEQGHVPDCTDTDDGTEFEVQDMIQEEVMKALEQVGEISVGGSI